MEKIKTETELQKTESILEDELEQEIKSQLNESTIPSVHAFDGIDTNTDSSVKVESAEANVFANHQTGEQHVVDESSTLKYKDISIKEIVDGADLNSQETIDDIKNFGLADLSDEDAMIMVNLLRKVKMGEDVSVYKEMPEKLKQLVRSLSPVKSAEAFRATAREMLNQMISDINLDKEFVDFNTALAKELEMPDILSMYADHNREKLEKSLLETADKIQEEAPDKASTLREISKSFTDSYTFVRQKEMLNAPGINRILKKGTNVKRLNRLCDEFNYKYNNTHNSTSLIINDVKLVPQILERKIDEKYSYETILKFTALFLEICKNYNPNNLGEHAFMYYTVRDILNLDHVDPSLSEFNTLLVHNIEELMDLIENK